MNRTRRPSSLWLVVTLAGLAAVPATAPDPAKKAAVAKYWADQLQTANRELSLRGPAAAGVDRADAWNRKCEALLQTSQFTPAAAAFEKAAAESTVPARADLLRAMALLSRKSDARGFHVPATRERPYPPTYDVLDPAHRAAALDALFVNEFDTLNARLAKAKAVTDAGALAALVKAVQQLKPLDRVVHPDAKDTLQTDGLEKTLATNFAAAAQTWATTTTAKLDTIKAQSDELVETRYRDRNGNVSVSRRRRGATTEQQADVRRVLSEAERLAAVYAEVDKVLTGDAKAVLEPIRPAVQAAYGRARLIQNDAARGGTVNPNTGG